MAIRSTSRRTILRDRVRTRSILRACLWSMIICFGIFDLDEGYPGVLLILMMIFSFLLYDFLVVLFFFTMFSDIFAFFTPAAAVIPFCSAFLLYITYLLTYGHHFHVHKYNAQTHISVSHSEIQPSHAVPGICASPTFALRNRRLRAQPRESVRILWGKLQLAEPPLPAGETPYLI